MYSINPAMIIFASDSMKRDTKWVTEFAHPLGRATFLSF